MSFDFIKICRDGIKGVKNSEELSLQYNFREKDDKYQIINRKTKETVAWADTELEAMEYRSDLELLEDYEIAANLRSQIYLDKGLTVGDLFFVLESYPTLKNLLDNNFPLWNDLSPKMAEKAPNNFIIQRKLVLEDGELSLVSFNSALTFSKVYSDLAVELDSQLQVIDRDISDVTLLEGENNYSLLDLLFSLFEKRYDFEEVYFEDGEICRHDGDHLSFADPMKVLFSKIYIVNGTLKDFFNYVANHKDFQDFLSAYSWCKIDLFQKEINSPLEKDDPSKIDVLKLNFAAQEHSYKDFDTTLEYGYDFCGYGPAEDDESRTESYALDLTPVNRLANLPVEIDRKVKGFKWPTFDRAARKAGKPAEEIKEFDLGKIAPTVLELFSEIFWEISFFGTPEKRSDTMEMLDARVAEAKNDRESLSKEEWSKKYKSSDDVFDEIGDKLEEIKRKTKEEFGD